MKTIYFICMIALLGAMMVTPAAATTWDVHTTEELLNAVTNAGEGDTIFVYNGNYTDTNNYPLCLSAPNITLIGESRDGVIFHDKVDFLHIGMKGNAADGYVDSPAHGCIIEKITVIHSGSYENTVGIDIRSNSPGCIVRNVVFKGLCHPFEASADNTTFENNVVSNSTDAYYAIRACSNSSTYVNNTFINNKGAAITINKGANNIVTKNNFISNTYAGIELWDAGEENKIYLNNFVNNGATVVIYGSAPTVTYWNSTSPIEYPCNGTTCTGYLGNYWSSDYTGSDGDGDGLGDTSYVIPVGLGEDYHPLMSGFENYLPQAAEEAPTPPTSFLISGNITYDNGNPVLNPTVTVRNMGTSEDFTVKTAAGSNYYRVLTDSSHVSAGNAILINASDDTVYNEATHIVTASEIETGGFMQDMILESGDKPDLIVTEMSGEWVSLSAYSITYTVKNNGSMAADASTTSTRIDGTEVATEPVPALAIGESHTSTVGPFTLSDDNDTIEVCADSGNVIYELDETNNCLSNLFEAPSIPDLIVWGIAKTPGDVSEENILGVRVKNIGTANAGSFDVSLSIDGTQVLLETVISLAAGETTELEYTWTPAGAGEYALSATVDTNNDVEEFDETNNDYARTSVIISSTDWPQFNYDASGIGFTPSSAPSSDTVKWISEDIGAGGGLSWGGFSDMGPVVAGGKIFTYCGMEGFSSTPYDVICLDEETGELLWQVSLPYSMIYGSWAPLGYDDGMVFCTVNHYVVALDANDGSIVWECDLDSPDFEGHAWSVNSGPTIADGKVFAGTYDEDGIGGEGGLAGYVAIDEYTGEKLWQTTGDGHCDSTPAYYDGVVYAGFDYDWYANPSGGCYALDADTGEEVWKTWLPFSVWGSVSVDEDYVYGANYNFYGPGQVFILYRNNGTVKVISESLRTDSTPAVAYDNIYLCGGCTGYSDTGTFCVDKETLEVLWSAPAGSWTASPAVADGKVYVGGFCYDAFTGEEIFSYEQGGLSPVIANGCLFNVQNGRVVCFEDLLLDLTVSAIDTPANLRSDVINPITATIENLGGFDAGNFDVSLAVDGIPVDAASVTSLASGENTTVEFLWTPSSTGNQTLTVTADASDAVTESDESNNNRSQTADVLEKLTVTTNVRIEGKNDTVWTGDVTFSNSTITASDGSVHYLNEPTALGALDEADRISGFGYVLVNYEWGLYVEEIAGEPPIVWDGWMYRVNYISPSFGAPGYTLADNDEVLWYFGIMWPLVPPLAIELDKTTVMTGEEIVANVTAYNDTSMAFEPVDTAEVYVDGVLYGTTDPSGKLTILIRDAGSHQIRADKGTWADYTRSNRVLVDVTALKVDIGDYVVTEGSSVVAPITVYGIENYGTTTLSIE